MKKLAPWVPALPLSAVAFGGRLTADRKPIPETSAAGDGAPDLHTAMQNQFGPQPDVIDRADKPSKN